MKFVINYQPKKESLKWLDREYIRKHIKEIIEDSNSVSTRNDFLKIIEEELPGIKDRIVILSTTTDMTRKRSYIKANPTKNKFFNEEETGNILTFAIRIKNDMIDETIWNFITPEAIAFSKASESVSISTWLDERTIIDALNKPGIHLNEKPSTLDDNKMKQFKIWSLNKSNIVKFFTHSIYSEELLSLNNLPPYKDCEYFRFSKEDLIKYPTFLSRYRMIFEEERGIVQFELKNQNGLKKHIDLNEHFERTEEFINSMKWKITEEKITIEDEFTNDGINISALRAFIRDENIDLGRHDLMNSAVIDPELLIVSHIVPVKETIKKDIDILDKVREIIDIDNCIFVPTGLDKLFDRFLITFDDSWNVIMSPSITEEIFIEHTGKKSEDIMIQNKNEASLKYLEQHRKFFKEKHNLLN